jgi:CRP-like cAMP-binding protein
MINLFSNIQEKNKEKLLNSFRSYSINYSKGKKIIDVFRDNNEIGIINSGYIQIIKNNYNGTSTIIEELYEDDVISSLFYYLKNDVYEIIAKEDTKITIMDYREILGQTNNSKSYNQLIKNLFSIISKKMVERNEHIEILSERSIRNKLLEYFNINAQKNGSRYIYLPFNFSDLANYLAIDRSAMSRELSYLKEEGFISIKGERITLLYR